MVVVRCAAALLVALASTGCLEPNVDHATIEPERAERAPTLAVSRDEQQDQLVFTAVEAAWTWDRLGVMADAEGTNVKAGGADDGPAVALKPQEIGRPSTSTENLYAGDVLEFCAIEGTAGPITYRLVDIETNTLVYETTFQSVAACD